MSDPSNTTITLGELSVQLVEPPSLMSMALLKMPRNEDADSEDVALYLAFGAAAMRMCWPKGVAWPARPRPPAWVPGVRLGRYGFDVWEGLRAATKGQVDMQDLQAAVYAALNWAISCGYTSEELQAARDFSEGQGEE